MKKIELTSKKTITLLGAGKMENQETMDKIIDFFENNPKDMKLVYRVMEK